MKTITYKIEHKDKKWHIMKYIEDERSFNFYPVFESDTKKECEKKLKELKGSE